MKKWLLASAASTALAISAPAPADDARLVVLRPEPPFDRWCVAPVCADPGRRAPLIGVPKALSPDAAEGLLQGELERRLVQAIDRALDEAGLRGHLLAKDLLHAIERALAPSGSATDPPDRLGAAVTRAGLVVALDDVVAKDARCVNRWDALYEGLAVSVALAPLRFPEAGNGVPEACAETARAAARWVDGIVVGQLLPPGSAAALRDAGERADRARRECRDLPPAASAEATAARAAVSGLLRDMDRPSPDVLARAAHEAKAADGAFVEVPRCASALAELAALDVSALEAARSLGLSRAELGPLLEVMRAADDLSPAAGRATELARSTVRRLLAREGLREADLSALLDRLVASLGIGDRAAILARAVAALRAAIVVEPGGATIHAARMAAALRAEYGLSADGTPTLRSLLGIAPTPWIVEVNAGLPKLDSNDVRLVGDARLGYEGRSLGLVARGALDYYDLSAGGVDTDNLHASAAGEAWWVSGAPASRLRVELRLRGSFEYFDATFIALPGPARALKFDDSDSLIGRGGLTLGARIAPSERLLLRLSAGGGAQYETHDATKVQGTIDFRSTEALTAHATLEVLALWRVAPRALAIRALGSGDAFRVTRDALAFTSSGGISVSSTEQQQIHARGRLFVDLDLASVAGFVPSAWGGADMIALSGGASRQSTFIPIAGVGFVRR